MFAMNRNALRGILYALATLALLAVFAGCGGGGGWSSDIIAFQAKDDQGVMQIWATDGRGRSPVQLTTQGFNAFPSVSGTGRIVFCSMRDGDYEVYIMNVDGTGQQRLTQDPAHDMYPSISWDGTKIAFVSRSGTESLYVMNADGTGVTQLASGTYLLDTAFTRDGSTVAFVNDSDIYTVPVTGGPAVKLLGGLGIDECPCYSPDDTKIAYAWPPQGHTLQVCLANADGTEVEQLTYEPHGCGWPAWSPDGSKIAFVAHRDGIYRLCTMNPDGTGVAVLLHDKEVLPHISWGQ